VPEVMPHLRNEPFRAVSKELDLCGAGSFPRQHQVSEFLSCWR